MRTLAILFLLTGLLSAKPLNVVFFLVDDLGYMDVSPNNPETFYDTPNIEGLAKSGMRFTDAYAACPVCSPTRSSILTGQFPARTHNTWTEPDLPPSSRTQKQHSSQIGPSSGTILIGVIKGESPAPPSAKGTGSSFLSIGKRAPSSII